MELISEGIVFTGGAGTPAASSCFPAIAWLPDGTLLASWRVGSQKDSADGQILLSRSTDEGRSWSEPVELSSGPWVAEPGEVHYAPLTVLGKNHLLAALMWVDRSDPIRPFFNPVTDGLLPIRTWFCESRDGGRSWRDYRCMNGDETTVDTASCRVGCGKMPHRQDPLAITGPVLVLGDGSLACQFEVNKPYDDLKPWRHAAAWKISKDGGYNWPEYIEVANDSTGRLMYWDAHYAQNGNGYIVATFWTYDRQRQCDANIHLSESCDGGRTWSKPRDCGLVGQVCHPILLGGDRLLLLYVDRFQTRSIRAALSSDMGRSFSEDMMVYRHPTAQAELGENSTREGYLQDMELWTFGRIDAILDADRTVWMVYYAGDSKATDIRWARLQISEVRQSIGMHPHLVGMDDHHRAPRGKSKPRAINERI